MAKYENTFPSSILDLDSEPRYVRNSALIFAQNISVNATDGSTQGVVKNVKGNLIRSNYGIVGGHNVGEAVSQNKNKIYNAVKGSDFDYIIEYDTETFISVIVAQSTTGTRLNFREGERIVNMEVIIDPEDNGDLLSWSGDSNPPRIGNIERMKTWGVDGFTAEEIMLIKPPPIYPVTLESVISVNNAESNNMEDRFFTFGYRYKYKDGYYSCFSTWTPYFFEPTTFELDFETFENLGMLNIYNAVNITFNTGNREILGIDLLFKLSNSQNVSIIDTFLKSEEGWLDNTNQTILFDNSKVYRVLPESEYFRSYDNVPHVAIASTTAGNREFFANYLEDYDLIDKFGNTVVMDYTLELISNNITNVVLPISKEDVEFTYETPPITIDNAQIDIDFSNVLFVRGAFIYIQFYITSNLQEIIFQQTFTYVLDDDYADLTDFFNNSDFAATLNTDFTAYFEDNGGITEPDGGIGYILEQGFVATQLDSYRLAIQFPVVKYEIDNSPDPNTFVWDYFYDTLTQANYQNIGVNTSLKSRRSYEICMIYRDLQCRKTTALTSTMNTIFIPNINAVDQNQIQVNIPLSQKPPVWADTYKFGIKVNKGIYQQVMVSIFFVDGTYRWIKLDGVNKGKVNDGDLLVVKKDSNGPVGEVIIVKILDLKEQPNNFITGNTTDDGVDIIEPAGLYIKIRPENFDMTYAPNEFQRYAENKTGQVDLGGLWRPDINGDLQPLPLKQGSIVALTIIEKHVAGDITDYDRTFIVQDNYPSFEDWWNATVNNPLISLVTGEEWNYSFITGGDGQRYLRLNPTDHLGDRTYELIIRSVDGYFIFETIPPDVDEGIFFETPEVYTITDGEHQQAEHLLTQTFNCYCFGNGAESYQVRDSMTEKYITIDFCPTAVSEDGYRRINRYADITYSGVYNSNTNVNKLNEFNLSLANYKDDVEKRYGAIYKLRGRDTDLEIQQDDRSSIVYYGKDLLYNTDGSTNLQKVPEVLGQQDTFEGEYGISASPDGYDFWGFNVYVSDIKRGVVLKRANNGNFEISSQGMKAYFKNLFRNNKNIYTNFKYDQHYGLAILNVKYTDTNNERQFVTWLYSDQFNGWTTMQTFNPESMIRCNDKFFSFFNGEIYEHNIGPYNTFYGVEYPSIFEFVYAQDPSDRKVFKNINIEGTDAYDVVVETDFNTGGISASNFTKQENVWKGYIRVANETIDAGLLSVQGIGQATRNGFNLEFAFNVDSIISIGDEVRNINKLLVGTITNRTARTLTLDAVNNFSDNDFVMATKPNSIQQTGILGSYMKVRLELQKNTYSQVYSVFSDVEKSFE